MIQKLENPTVQGMLEKISEEYANLSQKLIEENIDIEAVKYIRGKLSGLRYVAELLGKDITLVVKQEGVKE